MEFCIEKRLYNNNNNNQIKMNNGHLGRRFFLRISAERRPCFFRMLRGKATSNGRNFLLESDDVELAESMPLHKVDV